MTPRVCLVTSNLTRLNKAWTQTLRHLGIDYTLCVATSASASASIQTPQGVFAANSPDLRNYFRQFDAVIPVDNTNDLAAAAVINYALHWLSWNAAEDPAFLFFNPHFSVSVTDVSLPSDFPIVRPNASNLANTLHAADGGSASAGQPVWAGGSGARGACVLFLAESIRAHVMTVCNAHTNRIPYYWRLNPALHGTLANTTYTHRVARNGKAGEIIAVPAPPTNPEDTETYPSDCIVAYRYRNCFWLPQTLRAIPDTVNLLSWYTVGNWTPMLFWLLYGLQLAGVRPRYRLPVQMETDHPLDSFANTAPFNFSYLQQMQMILAQYDYMRDFARRTGLAVVNGVRVGGRHRTTSITFHWNLMYSTSVPAEARAVAQQVNQLLIAGHREGTLPCSVHDHTAGNFQGGYWLGDVRAGFRRHSGMRYGAPNNVPINRGRCCVAPHVLPAGVAGADAQTVQVGDTEMIEWDHTMSGTGDTFNLPLGNIHAARIIIESEIEEMLALGFPDGYCAGHKYTNTAANASGGECYWQALKAFGFRGVRSASACNAPHNTKRVVSNRLWHGFHLVTDIGFDLQAAATGYTRGLYYPGSPTEGDGVRHWQLDHSSDISSGWTTNPALAWRAYRRVLCQGIGNWLFATAVVLGGFYIHAYTNSMIMSLSDPLARFDGWSKQNVIGEPHYCHVVELLEAMDAVIRLLPDVLYWGTITDVMDLREKVMGS